MGVESSNLFLSDLELECVRGAGLGLANMNVDVLKTVPNDSKRRNEFPNGDFSAGFHEDTE